MTLPLPVDDVEPRRCMRLVWTLATSSGLVVWDRSAAAAAALERFALDAGFPRNACPAATVAAAEVLRLAGGLAEEPRRREEKREGMMLPADALRARTPDAIQYQDDGVVGEWRRRKGWGMKLLLLSFHAGGKLLERGHAAG